MCYGTSSERTNSVSSVDPAMEFEQWIALFFVAIMVLSMVAYSATLL